MQLLIVNVVLMSRMTNGKESVGGDISIVSQLCRLRANNNNAQLFGLLIAFLKVIILLCT